MKLIVALALVVVAEGLLLDSYTVHFTSWKAHNNRTYGSSAEEQVRFEIFKDNVDKITKHNSLYEAGQETYFMAVNKFADMTSHEFAAKMNGAFAGERSAEEFTGEGVQVAGPEVNWVTKGAVTPVKDQGQCGSCWAFSTCAGIEGTMAVAGKPLASLAPQELVDCDKADGNQGCNGGFMTKATQWAVTNGLCGWDDYKYTARGGTCRSSSCKAVSKPSSWKTVARSATAFIAALSLAPISIGADAQPWQFYSGGIFSKNCGTSIDHGILAAGFTDDYILVKNSWGTSWGESGYIRLSRTANSGNECGILNSALTSSA